jgi:hypothetical protein
MNHVFFTHLAMVHQRNPASQQLPTFILIGIAVAMLIGLLVIFTYVLVWGIILGGFFWMCSLIKCYFIDASKNNKSGRIIDYER